MAVAALSGPYSSLAPGVWAQRQVGRHRLLIGQVLPALASLPAASVHSVVTSPPYWGLRDYGVPPMLWPNGEYGVLGSEPVPDCLGWATGLPCGSCYVCHSVSVYAAVARVLRPDGCLMLNLGDCYSGSGKGPTGKTSINKLGTQERRQGFTGTGPKVIAGTPAKGLLGIPWRVALALQAHGWILRGAYVWDKPNPMPESVTDRCTTSHEYVFHLVRQNRYYWDATAIAEPGSGSSHGGLPIRSGPKYQATRGDAGVLGTPAATRNKRSVWRIATSPYAAAHFATFPSKLAELCLLATTSAHGVCDACGKPWRRLVATERHAVAPASGWRENSPRFAPQAVNGSHVAGRTRRIDFGWHPGCTCGAAAVPATVLDPFGGAGTVSAVAQRLGRASIYIDVNPDYGVLALQRVYALYSQPAQLALLEAQP